MKTTKELLQNQSQPKELDVFESIRNSIALANEREGQLHKEDGLDCGKCKNKGYTIILREDLSEASKRCECMDKRDVIRNIKKSGLGSLTTKTVNEFECNEEYQRMMKDTAIDYLFNGNGSWFVLLGQSGCGKTHLCAAVANKMINDGKKATYIPWNDFVANVKEEIIKSNSNTLLEKTKNSEVLYIDDLFKRKPTEADIDILFKLINHRYLNDLVTIISSERFVDQLMEIDQAITGRIIEMSSNKKYMLEIDIDSEKNYRLRDR